MELAWLLLVCRLVFGHAGERRPLPHDLPGRLVEAVDLPLVLRQVVHWLHVAVESRPEGLVAGLADGGGHEDAVAPHDRARGGDAGNRRLPLDVLAGRDVPFGHRALAVAVARAASPRNAGQLRGPVGRLSSLRPVPVARPRQPPRGSCGGVGGDARERQVGRSLHEANRFDQAAALVERQRGVHLDDAEHVLGCRNQTDRRLPLHLQHEAPFCRVTVIVRSRSPVSR